MTPDPREDALAKAREALSACLNDTPGWPARCLEAIQRITALSAPPSQSESDPKWAAAAAQTSSHRRDHMIDAIRHRELLTRAQALTPYVRPAAEIQAEIERLREANDGARFMRDWVMDNDAKIAALTWTLTPPTQEPR